MKIVNLKKFVKYPEYILYMLPEDNSLYIKFDSGKLDKYQFYYNYKPFVYIKDKNKHELYSEKEMISQDNKICVITNNEQIKFIIFDKIGVYNLSLLLANLFI